MATSSNVTGQAAAAATETGSNESVVGNGSANVSFEGSAPVRQEASMQAQSEPAQTSVESIVTQNMSESPMMRQQAQQNVQARQTQQNAQATGMSTRMASSQQPSMHPADNLVMNARTANQPSQDNGIAQLAQRGFESNDLQAQQTMQAQSASRSRFPNAPTAKQAQRPERETQRDIDRMKHYQDLNGREEIRREGVIDKPAPVNSVSKANRRFRKSKQHIQETIQNKLKKFTTRGKGYSGTSFYETIVSDASVMPHCASIGSENLLESLREPNSTLLDIVNAKLAEYGQEALELQYCLDNISVLVDAINSLNIEVTLEKTPVNINNSIQVRVLRAHYGRGVRLHPTQTKAYNADYDGDPVVLNMDQKNLSKYSRAMTRLVDIEGNPTIDSDFFPLDHIDTKSNQPEEIKKEWRENLFAWMPSIVNKVYDAYEGACNEGDWVGLLRAIDDVVYSNGYSGMDAERVMSTILKDLYDFSVERRGLSLRTQFNEMVEHSNYNPPSPNLDPFVYNLVDLVDEIVAGRPAPNFQDFTRFYNKYYGDVKGKKNVPFRLLADFAKAVNRTDLITVGSDIFGIKPIKTDSSGISQDAVVDMEASVSINQLWQFTCAAGISKQIAGRMHMGSRQLAVSTQVKTMVSRECPLPSYDMNADVDQQFRDWIRAFVNSYNRNMRMLDISQISFRQGMTPVRGEVKFKGIDEKSLEGIAKAMVEVYGDKTVESVFPKTILGYSRKYGKEQTDVGIVNSYRNMSIENFSVNNRLSFKSEYGKDQYGNDIKVPRKDVIARHIANDEFTPMDILLLVADRRTKQLGDYNKSWLDATKENFNTLSNIQEAINRGEYNDYANSMIEFMHLMSPDMFDYFGMDSPITFANSKWGKKLINANNLSEFRSHLVSMTIEYRLNKSSKILEEMKSVNGDSVSDIDTIETLNAAFELEMDSLASSSMVWDTIAKESLEGNSVFLALIRDNGIGKWNSKAQAFWSNPDSQKYHTLITFLKSNEPYEIKVAVLADVTRVRQNYSDVSIDEIMGQLAHHPDRLHAGSRFDMDGGIRSDIDTMKESVNRINSYRGQSSKNVESESNRIIDEAKEDKLGFEKMLRRFSDDPGYMVHVDTILAADAIASIYDKTYDDSEKIKQQTVVNGYFGAISLQRSGGYYTHLQQTDNAVVNMIGFDQLTVIDIVRILGNPDIEVTVYDEFGCPAKVSRSSLCGGDTIDDVIKYLDENRHVSLACRRFIAGVDSSVDGKAHMTATNDVKAGDTATSRIFSLLNDRPRFLAIAALCTPANDNVGRNLAEMVHDNLNNLCNFIGYYSHTAQPLTLDSYINIIETTLGITPETIVDLRTRGSFDEEASDLDYEAVGNLYSEIIEEILDCIDVVQKSNISLSGIEQPYNMALDESSIVAYYDARQQLSGARTATMIGIEGSETKKNLVLKEYLKNRPDRYMMSENGETVIPVVEGLNPEDLSLEHGRRKQTGSICKFLEVKREKGAETFNAKSKKFSDDGTNSIIKFVKMGTRSMFERFGKKPDDTWSIEDGRDLITQIEKCNAKHEAVEILANALIEADRRLGYTDGIQFVESDYWNRADLMIAENEDGTFEIRTLEQLAVAMRNRLSDTAIESEDTATIVAELDNIANTLGTTADPFTMTQDEVTYRCLSNVSIHSSIGDRFRIDRALRPRSSSTERNYALMYKIFQEVNALPRGAEGPSLSIPSRDWVEADSRKKLNATSKPVKDAVKKLANPNYPNGSYDFVGSVSKNDIAYIPGPQSLALFDVDWSSQAGKDAIEKCYMYGMTAAFIDPSNIPPQYSDDAIWTGDLYILPFFDMRLNGSMSKPIMPAPAQFPFNPDNVIVNVEDTTYEFKPGDATYHPTQELTSRIKVNYQGDDQVFDVYRLFPNVLRAYPDSDFQMDFCTNEEVQKYIVNGELNIADMVINGFDDAVIDIGVIPENENFEREKQRFNIRLEEYIKQFDSTDADGFLTKDVRYDSIVGFVKIVIDSETVALAPIWPFHLEESGSVPTTFKVDKVEFDDESHSFSMGWSYSGDLEGQYIKAFEGIGASNKMMASSDRARSRNLQNGLAVDGFYSTSSVASRLFASNKRIHTMISLMMIPRVDTAYAYNFADHSGSFPGNPEFTRSDGTVVNVKEALSNGEMGITDWIAARNQIKEFHVDPQIDALVRFWVDKCIEFGTVNPSTLLATKTNYGISWPMATEFECFMDTSLNFQNALMKFMNAMQPSLCPSSIEDNSDSCLFKPVVNNTSEDYGVLQMLVPHYNVDGEEYLVPENVYLSFGFFGDEFSGFKKVNFNAFERSIDSLNVSNNMNGFELSQMMAFGRSGMSSIGTMGANMISLASDGIMNKR